MRKSSPNVTEEAGEIAQQLNDLVDVAMTGDRLANNFLARNTRTANLGYLKFLHDRGAIRSYC